MRSYKPIIIGASGAAGLLVIFFGTITLVESFNYSLQEFQRIWYWILILASGFGTQIGLYIYIRQRIQERIAGATAEVAAAGTISTGSMIACCAHYLVNILPIIGISAAAMFLVQYQLPFILLGVFSNLVGITIMMRLIQKHRIIPDNSFANFILTFDMVKVRKSIIVFSIIVLSVSFFVSGCGKSTPETEVKGIDTSAASPKTETTTLAAKEDNTNNVTFVVTPIDFSFDQPVRFTISINTHSVDLDFDLTAISILEDDKGSLYEPTGWEGSPPGGHHRSGTLSFPKFDEKTKSFRLTIKNVAEVPERVFNWELQ